MKRQKPGAEPELHIARQSYKELLERYRASGNAMGGAIRHLTALGYTKGQARNAVYRFRLTKRDADKGSRQT